MYVFGRACYDQTDYDKKTIKLPDVATSILSVSLDPLFYYNM